MKPCNCQPKLEKLNVMMEITRYKWKEQVTIPAACPVHSKGDNYLAKIGREYREIPNPLAAQVHASARS